MNERKHREREDELSRLFRTTQHKLDEMPSRQAWRRLEQRLEARRIRKRTSLYRYTTLAAAAVAALVMITTLLIFENRMASSDAMAENTTIAPPTETEAIAMLEEESADEMTVKYEVEEKTSGDNKKDIKVETPKKIAPAKQPQQPTIKSNDAVVIEDADDIMIEEIEAEIEPEPEPIAENKPTSLPPPPPMPAAVKPKANESTPTATVPSKPKARAAEPEIVDIAAAEEDLMVQTEKSDNISKKSKESYNKKNNVKDQPTSMLDTQFDWLVGSWNETEKRRTSVEQWSREGNMLRGEGYVVENGDTVFAEEMRIVENAGTVFFETVVEKDKKPVQYRLVKMNSDEVVFENNEVEFPKQVVIERKGRNKFQTIFQNAMPSNIDERQLQQLNHRNNFSGERAVRNLSRSRGN